MKYLFITNEVGLSENANSNIVWAICREIMKANEVHVFSISSFVKQRIAVHKGYPVYSFGPKMGILRYSSQYNRFGDLVRLIPILFKPLLWGSAARLFLRIILPEQSESIESFFAARKIQAMNKQQEYDRIIAVCAPHASMHIAAKLRHPNFSIYQLDPFHSNTTLKLGLVQWRLSIEMQAHKNAEYIYMTSLGENEYKNTALAKYRDKWHVVDFPLMYKHAISKSEPSIEFAGNKINCLYGGALDMNYRNPKVALKIAKSLGDAYFFYFIGINCVEVIENVLSCKDSGIICLNPLPSDEIYKLMTSADFLVNIGNTMKNQMPSKIIDYMSTGKPIINIVKSRECPTLQYTSRYPLCIDVQESDANSDSVLTAISEFCTKNRGQTIPFKQIEDIFIECTPAHVASIIMENIH